MSDRSHSQILASAVALTTSATASTKTLKCQSADQHSIYIEWTPGTASNVLTLTIETRNGAGQWTQDCHYTESSGALTRVARSIVHTATGTTVVPLVYDFNRQADELRVKYAESEAGSSTKGTITVTAKSRASGA